MSNQTIETNLAEILKELQSGQKKILEEISTLKTDVAVLKANQVNMMEIIRETKNKQDGLINDVADLKGAKSLIIPIVVAVITSVTTLLIRAIPIN